jgi:bifunctional ADP-heptose synthase (sugar kinase/adenylyltransferase)
VVLFKNELTRAGGAANVACNCAALGARTRSLSVLGSDEAGDRLAELIEQGRNPGEPASRPVDPYDVKLRVIGRPAAAAAASTFETQPVARGAGVEARLISSASCRAARW